MENYNFQMVLLFTLHNFKMISLKDDFVDSFARITGSYFMLEELLKRPEAQGKEFEVLVGIYSSLTEDATNYLENKNKELLEIMREKIGSIENILNKFWFGGEVLEEYEKFKRDHLKE